MHLSIIPLSQIKIKEIKKLKQKKYRYKNNLYLCEGWRIFTAALESRPNEIVEIIVNNFFQNNEHYLDLLNYCDKYDIPIYSCSDKVFKALSDEESPSGILFLMEIKYFQQLNIENVTEKQCVFFENISDPGNLGTIIRTASWFGINEIIISPGSVDPYNAKVVRASAGGIFNVKLYLNISLEDVIQFGEKNNFKLVGTTIDFGDDLSNWNVSDKNIIFFGNEAHGLSEPAKQALNKKITVPGSGKMESLNLSVTSGIVLNHIYQKKNK